MNVNNHTQFKHNNKQHKTHRATNTPRNQNQTQYDKQNTQQYHNAYTQDIIHETSTQHKTTNYLLIITTHKKKSQ